MIETLVSRAARHLAAADELLREPQQIGQVAWPKVCTWLIRLGLENTVDAALSRHPPEVLRTNQRAKLLILARTLDRDLGYRATVLWGQLSNAAHHHAYELAPTAAELRTWHREVSALADDLRAIERPTN